MTAQGDLLLREKHLAHHKAELQAEKLNFSLIESRPGGFVVLIPQNFIVDLKMFLDAAVYQSHLLVIDDVRLRLYLLDLGIFGVEHQHATVILRGQIGC